MSASPTSGQRPCTCCACGKKFDYPVKGSAAPRHLRGGQPVLAP